jgi:TRAP-type C4-dicarboxylate transport system substrate-binding protein
MSPTRRRFVQGATIAPFFIGRSASADDANTVVKLATVAPPGTPWANQIKQYKKRLAAETKDLPVKLKLKAYLGGALGDEIQTAEACKRGTVQCFAGSIGALASAVPELEAIELPYLFSSKQTKANGHITINADKILDVTVHERIEQLLWKAGFKLLFLAENGFRSIGSTFPIAKLADLKGKKMRSQEAQTHLDTWRALGAAPVPIAVTEVLSSLQTGVVEGFDNTPLFAFAASWHMGIGHFTLSEHIYQPGIAVASRKFWDSLDPALQGILIGAEAERIEFTLDGRDAVRRMGPQLVENFRTAGITVNELGALERTAFIGAAVKAQDAFAKRTTSEGKALLKAIKDAL